MPYKKPFPFTEYQKRVQRVKERMQHAGFDLLISQDPANLTWLTGFDGWSFYTPQAVLVHLDEPVPIWFGRAQDARSAHITTDLPADNIIAYSESLVHHPQLHPYDELCDLVKARGWERAAIGVELDAHYYTARAHQHLQQGLSDARISDNHGLVNWSRLIKSEAEITYMHEAGKIVTATMDKAIERLRPGVKEFELAADIYHAQVTGIGNIFGDYTSLCPLIQVDEGTSTPHLTWTDSPIPHKGLVSMEIAAARHHYHAPLTRTMSMGKPAADILKLVDVIIEGGDLALDMAKPGVTCEEVEAVWQQTLKKYGYSKESRVGYSIGLNFPPDWGERTASLRPADTTELQAGMCFHFQSGMWLEDYGAAVSEPFVVTENGGERLSHVARELIVIN